MAGNKYKIFIDGKPIIILPKSFTEEKNPDSEILYWKGKQTVDEALKKIKSEKVQRVNLICSDADVAFHQFASRFIVVEAAGGLVKNNSGQCLFIFRRGKWDLPKGKMNERESIVETALREVREECGLKNLTIISPLINTYHYYSEKKKNVLKRTHWFLMNTDESEVTVQKDEDIENFIWLEKGKILNHISENTFPNILELVKNSFDRL